MLRTKLPTAAPASVRTFPVLAQILGPLAAAVVLAATVTAVFYGNVVSPGVSASLHVSYTGMNYYDPSDYFTGCKEWSWLRPSCFTPRIGRETTPRQVASDLNFVRSQHLGSFLRVWVSLDQLMRWDPSTGFAGYRPAALGRLDRVLAEFSARGIRVDLVLFVYSKGSGWLHMMRPRALDGLHPAMRAGYLRALHLFLRHVSHNPLDRRTIAVVDLQTEAYYQLEQYFNTPAVMGTFTRCVTGPTVNTTCVDQNLIHPWLVDLYTVAHDTAPAFLYTFADTGRLLASDASVQRYWESMYPVDVFDVHLYDDRPWASASRWASGLDLDKPWFAGETGCSSGHTSCTYNGVNAAPVDTWWIDHLRGYGASAALVESHATVWTYPNGAASQTLTPVGWAIACATTHTRNACANA